MNDSHDPPRIERRVALEWMLAASASAPFLDGLPALGQEAPPANGYGRDPKIAATYRPGDLWPLTFTPDQRRLVVVLCDLIIPADDRSPAASAVGVPDFLDEWISSPYRDQASDRNVILRGLKWLDEEAQRRGGSDFASLEPETQTAICRELARAAQEDRRRFPGRFFQRLRDLVAGGYYTTPVGMKDIGYVGNVALSEWNGPPQEALEHLGLEPE